MKKILFSASMALLVLGAASTSALTIGDNGEVRAILPSATSTVSATSTLPVRIGTAKDHAFREIDRRVFVLTENLNRLEKTTRLISEHKATLRDTVQFEIASLTKLRAEISADVDITALKAHTKVLTGSHTRFSAVVTQTQLAFAIDSVKRVSGSEAMVAGKFRARVDAAASIGRDTASTSEMLSMLESKITEANSQADEAMSLGLKVHIIATENAKSASLESFAKAKDKLRQSLQSAIDARQLANDIVARIRESL